MVFRNMLPELSETKVSQKKNSSIVKIAKFMKSTTKLDIDQKVQMGVGEKYRKIEKVLRKLKDLNFIKNLVF